LHENIMDLSFLTGIWISFAKTNLQKIYRSPLWIPVLFGRKLMEKGGKNMREPEDIHVNEELRLKNVLSLRKKMTASEVQSESRRLKDYLAKGGYKKDGTSVSVTYNIEQQNGEEVFDTEILLPIAQMFIPPEGCVCKPEFKLVNAVSIEHEDKARIQENENRLMAYIRQKGWQPITSAYNVNLVEELTGRVVMGTYIGVNPNVL
jgi:hypothetical protein